MTPLPNCNLAKFKFGRRQKKKSAIQKKKPPNILTPLYRHDERNHDQHIDRIARGFEPIVRNALEHVLSDHVFKYFWMEQAHFLSVWFNKSLNEAERMAMHIFPDRQLVIEQYLEQVCCAESRLEYLRATGKPWAQISVEDLGRELELVLESHCPESPGLDLPLPGFGRALAGHKCQFGDLYTAVRLQSIEERMRVYRALSVEDVRIAFEVAVAHCGFSETNISVEIRVDVLLRDRSTHEREQMQAWLAKVRNMRLKEHQFPGLSAKDHPHSETLQSRDHTENRQRSRDDLSNPVLKKNKPSDSCSLRSGQNSAAKHCGGINGHAVLHQFLALQISGNRNCMDHCVSGITTVGMTLILVSVLVQQIRVSRNSLLRLQFPLIKHDDVP
eukprot:gnl/MRDRNA2_/MRDRNA2_21411_c0_seq2.p1 gnl/MRDRNA2_/MRDRNA2_21411_c0~~gnl/MRDRNA2_/MRDRNA2_21411_c0_seq2.p1  ORF type:complete len:387 (+),score=40.00 gnl/MRDRNA2_/MRDRNA2_21411_c0_seq2:88-1248(+)